MLTCRSAKLSGLKFAFLSAGVHSGVTCPKCGLRGLFGPDDARMLLSRPLLPPLTQTKWDATENSEKPAAIAIIVGVIVAQVRALL